MIADDLYENLLRQRINIIDAAKKSNRILFVDTDAITTLFYSRFLLKDKKQIEISEKLASAINDMTQWDLVLFLEPDVEFVQDGTRNEKIHADREKYSEQIKQALRENNLNYYCLSGDYLDRFEKAKQLIADLGITTRF